MATGLLNRPDADYDTDADAQHDPSSHLRSAEHVGGARSGTQATDDDKFKDIASGLGDLDRKGDEIAGGRTDGPDALHNAENRAANDTVGNGYRADAKAKDTLLEKLRTNSKFRKRLAIAGALAGGSAAGSILVFMLLLPLKIDSVVNDLESKFGGASNQAMQNELESVLNQYIRTDVLRALNTPGCHKTIDPSCVVTDSTDGFFGKVFKAWNQNKMTLKLATEKGIIMGKRGNQYYLNLNGKDIDMTDVMKGKTSFFDLPGTTAVSKSELRHAVMDDLQWWQVYQRFKVGKYLEQRGIKRCIIACDFRDNFSDKVSTKLQAGKLFLAIRVGGIASQEYGVLVGCILAPQQCDTKLKPTTNGREASALDGQLEQALDSYIAVYGAQKLAKISEIATELNKNGLSGYITKIIIEKIADQLGGDGAKIAAGQAADKAIPIVGQVSFVLSLFQTAGTMETVAKYMSYSSRIATATAFSAMLASTAAEAQSGHTDSAELGSVTGLLSEGGQDMTEAPLYQKWFGGGAVPTTSNYKCNDGTNVLKTNTAAQGICPEENLKDPGEGVKIFTDILQGITAGPTAILGPILPVLYFLNNILGTVTGFVGQVALDSCKAVIPGCSSAINAIGTAFANILTGFFKQIIPNLLGVVSGIRLWDVAAMGNDATFNTTCQSLLGCGKVNAQTAASVQNQYIAQQKADFQSMSMYDRMFSTTTQYSLVSHLAVDMPTTFLTATNDGAAMLFSNPVGRLLSVFSSLFTRDTAFAAVTAQGDAFGIDQYAYDPGDPTYKAALADPKGFWDANCVNGPLAIFDSTANTLDTTAWQAASQTQDPNTGQPVNTATNPCMLLLSVGQGAAGATDPTILPSGSQNPDPPGSVTGKT